jgi:hypothetical protein
VVARHPRGRTERTRIALKIGRGDARDHARHPARGIQIDPGDPGVRVRAAEERDVERARQDEIGDVTALPGEEARVLDARDARADQLAGRPASSFAAASTAFTIPW